MGEDKGLRRIAAGPLHRRLQLGQAVVVGVDDDGILRRVTADRSGGKEDSGADRAGERWGRCGGTDAWPEWELFPTTPWNYGLVLDEGDSTAGLTVVEKAPVADQPWTLEAAPIAITARARRIPAWRLVNETVDVLREGPIRSAEPEETITLIPLGCARLRMSCLPVVSDAPYAREWEWPRGI